MHALIKALRSLIKDIQALRGIAVIGTVLAHTAVAFHEWAPYLPLWGFWTGVDLFLVISGFVISRSFVPELEASPHPWVIARAFWIKRVYRLLPAAVFWASVLVLLTIFANKTGIFGPLPGVLADYVRALLYVENFPAVHISLGPYWSLSLEEQFYLLLPLALILFTSIKRPIVLAALALGALLLYTIPAISEGMGYFRFAPLLTGIILYRLTTTPLYARLEPTWIRGPLKPLILIGLLGAMVFAGSIYWPYTHAPDVAGWDRWFVITGAATLIVWLASYDRGYASLPGLGPLLRWIGNRSYSIYLLHVPVLLLTYEVAVRARLLDGWIDAPIAWIISLGLGAVSYRWIEIPSQQLGRERSAAFRRAHENSRASADLPQIAVLAPTNT